MRIRLVLLFSILPFLTFARTENISSNTIKPLSCGFTISSSSTPETCPGASNGTVSATAINGAEPVTYLWMPGNLSGAAQTGLPAGTYTVYVTDATMCTDSAVVVVTGIPAMNLSFTSSNVLCANGNDGSIDISVTGGTSPYSYLWNNSSTAEDLNNISSGIYSVVITDNNGCQDSIININITEPPVLTFTVDVTNVSCFGGNNGEADISIGGGTPPYTYLWSHGPTSEDVNNLSQGSYTVTITDNNNCQIIRVVTVTEPPVISVNSVVTNVSCNATNNGAIDISVSGGVPGYTYLWSNNATTQDISNLTAGTYTVTVTDSNNCLTVVPIVVNQNANLVLSSLVTNPLCNGGSTGAIDLSVSAGTPPYSYNWSNGSTNQDLTNIPAGTYTVGVTDASGCVGSASINVNQPSAISISANISNVLCNGGSTGSINLIVSGGTPGYTYLWNTGATTQNISGLTAGVYSVAVTDLNGCVANNTFTISQPTAISLITQITHVSCNGANNGAINLTVIGGTSNYTYSWSNSATSEDINGLSANTYSVTVTDNNGCTASISETVTQPATLSLSANTINASCNGVNNGSIDLVVSGGTGPFNYFWSNGATTEDLNAIGAGTYTVTVTDANGCQANTSATISQPSSLSLTVSATPSACGSNTGSATVNVSGGASPYSYLWNDPLAQTTATANNLGAGTYSVIVTDATGCIEATAVNVPSASGLTASALVTNANCNGASTGGIDITVTGGTAPFTYQWSNSATSQDITNAPAGTYSLLITDAASCTYFISATVGQPNAILLNFITQNPLCNNASNGQVNLTVTGGSPGYSYLWSNGATTQNLTNVSSGSYSVTVTDNNGCTAGGSVTLNNPPVLLLGFNTSNVTCNGASTGAIDLSVVGGTAPYTYIWSNAATTQDLSGIPAGQYTVTVTDDNGCSAALLINITEPNPLVISTIDIGHLLCNGTGNGYIDISVSGGTLPYSYIWDNGATTQDLSGLSGGVYQVSVSDFYGCTETQSYTVNEPDAIVINITTTPADCGFTNGSATATVTGGTPGYSYLWNTTPAQTAPTANQLGAGGYSLTITDQNNCVASEAAIITSIGGPIIALDSLKHSSCASIFNDTLINYTNDGAIYISVTGSTPPYTYSWSSGQSTQDIANLFPGNYLVTVRDVNLCLSTMSFTITGPTPLDFSTTSVDVNCNGDTNGSIDLTVTGGTPPYKYFWNKNGVLISQNEDLNNIGAGMYVLQLNDDNNCIKGASVEVKTISTPIIVDADKKDESCSGKSDGKIDITVSGGVQPYTFAWSNQTTAEDLTDIAKGNYVVSITDANGCSTIQSYEINAKEACTEINIPNSFTPNGDDVNDKWIIRNLGNFPQNTVEIFNRWGQLIFSTNGYNDSNAWDGTYNGEEVSSATYYYFINLGNGTEVFKGTVTIVR
jgi:gliding motility-associated-like protein